MPSGQSACAVLLQDTSFAWGPCESDGDERAEEAKRSASATIRGWALAQSSSNVLRELSLAVPQGSLTAIVGDIGSGQLPTMIQHLFQHPSLRCSKKAKACHLCLCGIESCHSQPPQVGSTMHA